MRPRRYHQILTAETKINRAAKPFDREIARLKMLLHELRAATLVYSFLAIIFSHGQNLALAQHLPDISQDSNIVLVGDSHLSIAPIAKLKFQGTITNYGVSGYTTTDVEDLLPGINAKKGDIVILQVGINDLLSGERVYDISIRYMNILKTLKSKGLEVTAFALFPCVTKRCSNLSSALGSLNQSIEKMCDEMGVVFININESLLINERLNPAYSDDGLHLNDDGYKVWFKSIENELKKFPRT